MLTQAVVKQTKTHKEEKTLRNRKYEENESKNARK